MPPCLRLNLRNSCNSSIVSLKTKVNKTYLLQIVQWCLPNLAGRLFTSAGVIVTVWIEGLFPQVAFFTLYGHSGINKCCVYKGWRKKGMERIQSPTWNHAFQRWSPLAPSSTIHLAVTINSCLVIRKTCNKVSIINNVYDHTCDIHLVCTWPEEDEKNQLLCKDEHTQGCYMQQICDCHIPRRVVFETFFFYKQDMPKDTCQKWMRNAFRQWK